MHDFGYPCSMPRQITIDGLFVDDSGALFLNNHPADYQGLYLFTDPDDTHAVGQDIAPATERPFPYEWCKKVRVRGLSTASGKKPQLSPNAAFQKVTVVVEEV